MNSIYVQIEIEIRQVLSTVALPEIVLWENFKQFIARYVNKRYGPDVAKTLLARHFIQSTKGTSKIFLAQQCASLDLKVEYPDLIILTRGGGLNKSLPMALLRFLSMRRNLGRASLPLVSNTDQSDKRKIAVQYVHGFSNNGFGSDWDWFEASGLEPDQVVYLAENHNKIKRKDILLSEDAGIHIVSLDNIFDKILADKNSFPELNLAKSLQWLSLSHLCFGSDMQRLSLELLVTYLTIMLKWRCVFRYLGIGGYVNVGDANFDSIPKMHALESVGGVNLTYEFSATGFQSFFDACPTGRHQYLAWGPCSTGIIEHSSTLLNYRLKPKCIQFAGNMKLHLQTSITNEQQAVVDLIISRAQEKVVLIADSAPTHLKITSVKNANEFYQALVPLFEYYPDVLFVVKPQRPDSLSSLSRKILNDAQIKGNVILLDQPLGLTHFLFPVVNLVIGMPVYASIIFEAVAAGKDAICFDNYRFPHVIRKHHSEFSLVSDAKQLMNAVNIALRGELDLKELRHRIEPYGDGRGHERFGSYLKIWFDCLNEFGAADDALEQVVIRYNKAWPVPSLGQNH
ncbi:hypothetical protein [Owenweeksia hongkongensis]|uniref:hypothetical protein n=1 Tax=Owenweeksia hongkongensis TaxID=253245 RepID=UPI003A90FE7D